MSDFDGKFNYPDTTPYERRLYALNKELQERIDKAIEYAEHGIKFYITDDDFVEEVLEDMLNILKGSDSNDR